MRSLRRASLGPTSTGSERFRTLETQGFARCGSFSAEDARNLHDIIWDRYAQEFQIFRDDPSTWTLDNGEGVRPYYAGCQRLADSKSWTLMQERINGELDSMFGEGQWKCGSAATLLVNGPSTGISWTTPYNWHTDEPVIPQAEHPESYYVFVLLDDLKSQGGSTMIVEGSVRRALAYDRPFLLGGADLKTDLAKEHVWFEKLFFKPSETETAEIRAERFASEGICSAGVALRVVELTGSAGDIIIWDPRALHSASDNVNGIPRTSMRIGIERVCPRS